MKIFEYIPRNTVEAYGGYEHKQDLYNPSLFGEHLVLKNPHKWVGVVQDPINALVMSLRQPNMTWVAMGSFFKPAALRVLHNKKCIVFPEDAKQYDDYNEYVHDHQLTWDVSEPCYEWMQEQRTELILSIRFPNEFPEEKHPKIWTKQELENIDRMREQFNHPEKFEREVMDALVHKCGDNRAAAYASMFPCVFWDNYFAQTHVYDNKNRAYIKLEKT